MRGRERIWDRGAERRRFALLWCAAGLLEAPVMSFLFLGSSPLGAPWLAAGHGAAALLLFFAPPKAGGWLSPLRHWGEPLALWTALLPGLGWLLSGILYAAHDPARSRLPYFREEEEEEGGGRLEEGVRSREFSEERRLIDALDVMPAADILLGKDPSLKRGAVETLARLRSAEAIAWLLKARTDSDAEVRFHATSALTKLKREFEGGIRAAQKEVVESPAVAARQVALERVRVEYALSGLLDARQSRETLEGCRAALRRLAERSREALEPLFFVSRELEPEEALGLLERLAAAFPDRATLWLREEAALLFRMGRYGETARLLERLARDFAPSPLPEETPEDAEWRALCFWWGHA